MELHFPELQLDLLSGVDGGGSPSPRLGGGAGARNGSANRPSGSRRSVRSGGLRPEATPGSAPPPHWDDQPRALSEGTRLRTVSLAAGHSGVRAGMSIAEAQARCAALAVRPWDDAAITDAVLAGTTALLAASPHVTAAAGAPGMWWVGATGFEALGGEAVLACTLLAIAQAWHPGARVAIADSCVAARAATWAPLRPVEHDRDRDPARDHSALPAAITLVPSGGCARYLAPAPLGLLPIARALRDTLEPLGIRTVGALAALEPGDVEARWGAEGLAAWRLARGDDPRRPGLVRVEAPRQMSVELPAPVDRAEPVLFIVRAQLQRLLAGCMADGRAAAAVAITLILDEGRGRAITREVRPARPMARLEPLLDQCRSLLAQWVLSAPIVGVTVSIPSTAPLTADQGDLLLPSWREMAHQAEAVFARLKAVLDPEQRGDVVVQAMPRDTHRVEETGAWTGADPLAGAAPPPATEAAGGGDGMRGARGVLRLLPAPELLEVEEPHGVPDALWWRGRRLPLQRVEGPERMSGDWWRADPYARDYWRAIADPDGALLFYRTTTGAWYLQGWYD